LPPVESAGERVHLSRMSDFSSYDLHLHTHWSHDGEADGDVYFRRASEIGVRCIAITEHFHMDSQPELQTLARQYREVRLIPAAELTVRTSLGQIDLLCYNLPAKPTGELAELIELYRESQRLRGSAVSQAMQKLGLPYTDQQRQEALESYRPPHIIEKQGLTLVKNCVQRNYWLRKGYIDKPEQYVPLLRKKLPSLVEVTQLPSAEQVVPIVHRAGGLIVIAHPQGYFANTDVRRMDTLREECGLDGIECVNGEKVAPAMSVIYREYCLKHGLLSTAGSDCHSNGAVEEKFARHRGDPAWLDELLERIDR